MCLGIVGAAIVALSKSNNGGSISIVSGANFATAGDARRNIAFKKTLFEDINTTTTTTTIGCECDSDNNLTRGPDLAATTDESSFGVDIGCTDTSSSSIRSSSSSTDDWVLVAVVRRVICGGV